MSISLVYSLGFRATVSAARCLVVLPLLHLLLAVVLLHVGKINDDDDVQATSSEYSEESDLESLGGPGVSIGQPHAGASRMKKKRDSQASYTSDMMESESDFRELEMNMDIIDEYYYGVRIFPGQDPSQVPAITDL